MSRDKNKLCDDYAALQDKQQRKLLQRLFDRESEIADLRGEIWFWKCMTVVVLIVCVIAILAMGVFFSDSITNMLLYQ